METTINYTNADNGMAWVSSDRRAVINEIRRLAQKNPGSVIILNEPDENDGVLYCRVPIDWIKIRPPKTLSEDQRAAARERFAQSRGEPS